MPLPDTSFCFWLITAVEIVGMITMVASRGGSAKFQSLYFALFTACLIFLGLATMSSLQWPSGLGIYSGFVLGVMIVGATCEFSASTIAEAQHRDVEI